MHTSNSLRWLVVVAGAAMLLAVAAACAGQTVEVPGETVVVEKVVTETIEVPGETVVVEKEVIKTIEVPGETVTKEVVKEVEVPGETVVVEKEVTAGRGDRGSACPIETPGPRPPGSRPVRVRIRRRSPRSESSQGTSTRSAGDVRGRCPSTADTPRLAS